MWRKTNMKNAIFLVLFSGCATLSNNQPELYCGRVDSLNVYVNDGNARVKCKEALQLTNQAKLHTERLAEIQLQGLWDVHFTYKYLGYSSYQDNDSSGPVGTIP